MKNTFLLGISLICVSVAIFSFKNKKSKIQDTEAAAKYFQNELDFVAKPGTVKRVVQGKLDGLIIDLRKREHYVKGHISKAINLPFNEYSNFEGRETEFPELSKNKINYIYCYELYCNLSTKAAQKFASLGYPVKEIKGGFKAWKEHDYPIEK